MRFLVKWSLLISTAVVPAAAMGQSLVVCLGSSTGFDSVMHVATVDARFKHCRMHSATEPMSPTANRDLARQITGDTDQWVLVRYADTTGQPVSLAGIIKSVTISAAGIQKERTIDDGLLDAATLGIPLDAIKGAPNGSLVTVEVAFSTGANRQPSIGYFTLVNRWSPYGAVKSGAYAWVPLGLFATNFTPTDGGIPLGAFPVGLALGGRFYPFADDKYIGFSAMMNYAIYPGSSANSASAGYNFVGGAAGMLFDISNIFYAGGAYVMDFRAGHPHPGPVFVLGVGPGLLQILQAAH